MRFTTKRVVATAVAALGLTLGVAVPAQAATCASGSMCLWVYNDYSGGLVQDSRTSGSIGWPSNNLADSGATNGASCDYTRFYDSAALGGSFFTLWSEQRKGSNYRDPNFSNGAGTGADWSQNWSNRVSGWMFTGC